MCLNVSEQDGDREPGSVSGWHRLAGAGEERGAAGGRLGS